MTQNITKLKALWGRLKAFDHQCDEWLEMFLQKTTGGKVTTIGFFAIIAVLVVAISAYMGWKGASQ